MSFFERVKSFAHSQGHIAEQGPTREILIIDRDLVVKMVLAPSYYNSLKGVRWKIKSASQPLADFIITAVLDEPNQQISGYYLLNIALFDTPAITLKAEKPSYLSEHHHENLESIFGL
jgi:hypothetical protein